MGHIHLLILFEEIIMAKGGHEEATAHKSWGVTEYGIAILIIALCLVAIAIGGNFTANNDRADGSNAAHSSLHVGAALYLRKRIFRLHFPRGEQRNLHLLL